MTNREQEFACLGESEARRGVIHCASEANDQPSAQSRHGSIQTWQPWYPSKASGARRPKAAGVMDGSPEGQDAWRLGSRQPARAGDTKNNIFPSERFQHRLQRLKLPCAEQRHRISPETITRIKLPALPIWTDCFFAVIQRIAIVIECDPPTLDIHNEVACINLIPCLATYLVHCAPANRDLT